MANPPPYVIRSVDVPETEGHYPAPFDAEKLSIGRDLGKAAGTRTAGLWQERLLPGRRTSFTHAHSHEEEIVYVLSGRCHVRVIEPGGEPQEFPLEAGHVAAFPAGTGIAHCLVNHGDEEAVYLCFGERRPEVDRCFYPEDTAYDTQLRAEHPEQHWTRK